jgi:phosphatidylglycerophosphate synthase
MLDHTMRQVKARAYEPLARRLGRFSPLFLTLIALLFGLGAALALWRGWYGAAFAGWFFNRFFDGLDGAVARFSRRHSDFGGYADIVADFVVYGLLPVALVAGRGEPAGWPALAFLLLSFYVNAASWMYLSAILEKRARGAAAQGEQTTITMPGGVVGGTLTILFFSLFILLPQWLIPIFWTMSALTWVGILQRLLWARRHLRD